MGSGIGASLLRHGFPLTVLEHPGNQPLDKLLAAAAKTRPRAAQLAGEADILILCVTGSPQVEAVLFQQDGVLQGLRSEEHTSELQSLLRISYAAFCLQK